MPLTAQAAARRASSSRAERPDTNVAYSSGASAGVAGCFFRFATSGSFRGGRAILPQAGPGKNGAFGNDCVPDVQHLDDAIPYDEEDAVSAHKWRAHFREWA